MTNQPWECPRCKRMNAPFMPYCECNLKLNIPAYIHTDTFLPSSYCANDYPENIRCPSCKGLHGMWNGKPIHCNNL